MSAKTKVSALDHAMQTAHTWINDVAREFGIAPQQAAGAVGIVAMIGGRRRGSSGRA